MIKWDLFIPVSQNGSTFTNQSMWSITLTKGRIKKNHMILILSIDAGKAFEKLQHKFTKKKPLIKVVIKETSQHNEGHLR